MKKSIFIFISFLIVGNLSAQWNTDRLMIIGRNAMFFEDYVLAIQYFNQVIAVKPHLAEPFMFRGIARAQLGDFMGADRDLTEALNRNPFIPQAFYARGFVRHRLGFFQEAYEDFSKALEFSPNSSFVLLNRMSALANLGNYEDAIADLERFMRMNPRMTEVLHDKGRLQMAMNDTIGAMESFDRFIEAEPYNSMAWSARALLFLQEGDLDNALIHYNRAIELGSRFAGDFINRGIIHVQRHNFMQALSDYDTAIQMDGDNTLAFYNRALLRASLGDTNNALDDLNIVLRQDDSNMEARLRKASLEFELGNFHEAINDYRIIIARYPNFIPAYIGIAHSFRSLGNRTESMRYAVMAMDIEERLTQERANAPAEEEERELVAENLFVQQARQSNPSRRTEVFNRFAAQNMERAERESRFASHTRGTVQDRYTDLLTERNFVLTFYARADEFRRTNLFHPLIEIQNRERTLSSVLRITNNEIPLTEESVQIHFNNIRQISERLLNESDNSALYFSRAMEFAMLHDFVGAISDLDRTIALRPDFALAYFMRANIRHRQLEYENIAAETPAFDLNRGISLERQHGNIAIDLILRDYERVIALAPDFPFAYFNKANVLASTHNFQQAILYYTRTIELDPNFAEAYFNRGLLLLFTGKENEGLNDLSQAGELGMYQVYNLIQRFNR